LAALWVFSYHIAEPIRVSSPTLGAIAAVGHLGVPVFFVISGYCIMASAEKTRARGEPATHFLYWRFLRIFPPFWCSLLVVILLPFLLEAISSLKTGIYTPPTPRWMSAGPADWGEILTLTRAFFFPGEPGADVYSAVNSVYWTLAIEFQFYAVLFAALLSRRHFDRILAWVSVCGIATALIPGAYYLGVFLPYWPMFLLGIALNRILVHKLDPGAVFRVRSSFPVFLLGGLIGAAFVSLILTGQVAALSASSPHLCDFLVALACVALFWLVTGLNPSIANRIHRTVPFVRYPMRGLLLLGTISYSLYLVHGKLYQLPFMFARAVVPADSLLLPLLTMLGTILLTCAFYLLCEQPFLRVRRPLLAWPR